MEDFQSYEKMAEGLKALKLSPESNRLLEKVDWIVNEKIHGANFSFILTAQGLAFAKRKETLSWEDDFFAFQRIVPSLQKALFKLYDLLENEYPLVQAQLYGELFGGAYPHPKVKPIEGLEAIQTGVYYHPDIQFQAFDLALTNEEGVRFYLGYRKLRELCEAAKVPYVKAVFEGDLTTALNMNIEIESPTPIDFGLAPITDNIIEGVVIRPAEALLVDGPKGPFRPIIKRKNKRFKEELAYHQAQKWSYNLYSDQDEVEFYLLELSHFLNENRIMSAISKIGWVKDNKRKSQLRELVWQDILESYAEALDGPLPSIPALVQQQFYPKINALIQKITNS
jgi:Rnl2 family RNA ligase